MISTKGWGISQWVQIFSEGVFLFSSDIFLQFSHRQSRNIFQILVKMFQKEFQPIIGHMYWRHWVQENDSRQAARIYL